LRDATATECGRQVRRDGRNLIIWLTGRGKLWSDHDKWLVVKAVRITNGWKYTLAGGRAGYDPSLRAALCKYEVGAQLSDLVIYPNASVDDKGEALTGARKDVLHFDAGKLPPVSVFWHLAMYGSDMLFVENEFGRNSFGRESRVSNQGGTAAESL